MVGVTPVSTMAITMFEPVVVSHAAGSFTFGGAHCEG